MKIRGLVSLALVACVALPLSGWAQALFDPAKRVYEPSTLFPIIPEHDLVGAPDAAIPTDIIKAIYDRCRSKVPGRFTPDAHETYCTCAAAATQGTITLGDLKDLQKEENRQLGSKVFEKYVHNVMKPCMESPTADIEYMYCVMYRKNDWRIRYPLPYCRCMSQSVAEEFKVTGEEGMMISWGADKIKKLYKDPVEAFWENDKFQKARRKAREACASSYMDPENFK